MHIVKNFRYIKDYQLLLTFEDEKSKLVDLKDHLEGEIFAPLKNITYFKKIMLNQDLDTIMWENGADVSPDFLYDIGYEIK